MRVLRLFTLQVQRWANVNLVDPHGRSRNMATMVLGWDVHYVRRMLGATDTGRSLPSTHIEQDATWLTIVESLNHHPEVHAYLMCRQDSYLDFHDPLVIGVEVTSGEATTPEVMWTHVQMDDERKVGARPILQQLLDWRAALSGPGPRLPEPALHFSGWCSDAVIVEERVLAQS